MNNFKYNPIKMTSFKWFVLENFPFLEEDFDSLTSYGLWCKLKEYFDKVAHNVNDMGLEVQKLSEAFLQLKNYIDNYFKNLDVQDEINNKLDEMVESGVLQEIISTYLNANAIWGFDNVSSMIQSQNLINGSYARTLGYYNRNDGGSALYKIRNVTNEDTVDGKFIIAMNNQSLIAELIVENNKIDIRMIGARTTDDIKNYVLAIIDKGYECFIPSGIWKTSPLQIARYNSAKISGQEIYGNNNSNGTILSPVGNQDYILKVGYDNTTSISNDISINNIEFTTGDYTCINAILFSRVQFSNFQELGFRKCKCTDSAFRIRETWETRFGRVIFRQTDSPYALIFGAKVGTGNISSNYFEFLSFEGCRGTCIKFEEKSQYSMNTIDTIDFESGSVAFNDETRVSINAVESYTKIYVIETGNGHGEISINNLNINSIAQHAYVNNNTGTARAYDTVIKCNNTDTGYFNFAIGTISGVGNINKPTLIDANTIDKFHCNNNIFQGGTYFNCFINGCRVFDYLPNKFADNYLICNLDGAYRDLKVDGIRCYCTSKENRAVRVANLNTQGNRLYVHAKGNGNINFGGSDHVTLSDVSDYQWFALEMLDSALGSNNNLLLGTNTNVEIDDYFFTNV